MATKKKNTNVSLTFNDIEKVEITKIDPEIFTQKGLFGEGCYESDCDDICCKYGCDVDLASIKLIEKHQKEIEKLTKVKIQDCFSAPLKASDEYVGGGYRETAVNPKIDRCAFHFPNKQGCTLFYLWAVKGVSKKIVPTICKVYPITWDEGEIMVDRPLRKGCKCQEPVPVKGLEVENLYETQAKEVQAVFDIKPSILKEAIAHGEKLKAKRKRAKALSSKRAIETKKKNAAKTKKKKTTVTKKRARA